MINARVSRSCFGMFHPIHDDRAGRPVFTHGAQFPFDANGLSQLAGATQPSAALTIQS